VFCLGFILSEGSRAIISKQLLLREADKIVGRELKKNLKENPKDAAAIIAHGAAEAKNRIRSRGRKLFFGGCCANPE
jgi:hypothetical protein